MSAGHPTGSASSKMLLAQKQWGARNSLCVSTAGGVAAVRRGTGAVWRDATLDSSSRRGLAVPTSRQTSTKPLCRTMPLSGPMGSLPLPGLLEKRFFASTRRTRALNIDNINPRVKEAKYAVRGELAIKSEQYRAQLARGEGKDLPFDSVIAANIGNPQQLDQKPITFFRQVASILENPGLLEKQEVLEQHFGYKSDVFERARKLLDDVKSVGAYSQSQGAPGVRQSVADFIERRDGYPADPDNIYLCGGASAGVNALLNIICASPSTGVLVPIPQYPLYTATLSILNAKVVPYYLNEENSWSTDLDQIKQALKKAQKEGIDVRAVVVINPGNPTGGSLETHDINSVLELAAEEELVVMADEVYQTNVFKGQFHSFKKCLRDLQKSEKNKDGKFDNLELASLHSVSKGMVGECGHRGGYYEMVGFDPEVSLPFQQFLFLSHMFTGRRPNLQIRLHHALPARHRPMHRGNHGQPPAGRRPLLPLVPRGIRQHLQLPPRTRARPLRRLPRNGGREVPVPARVDVPVPHNRTPSKGDRGRAQGGQASG
jgi:alanine transaminase